VSGEVIVAVITGGSIAATAVVTYIETRRKLQREYDLALRTERVKSYRKLWPLTKSFRRFVREDVSIKAARDFCRALNGWYFREGFFLTPRSMERYETLLETVHDVLDQAEDEEERKLTDAEYELVYRRCRDLRASLTEDLGSRIESEIGRRRRANALARKRAADRTNGFSDRDLIETLRQRLQTTEYDRTASLAVGGHRRRSRRAG
jgi:hypothetical protein